LRVYKSAALLVFLVAGTLFSLAGPGVDSGRVEWKTFEEAIKSARASGKLVVVDVYTTWCGWCKKMDKNTYANEKVVDYLNRHFEAVKLNAESNRRHEFQGKSYTERELAKGFGASGYPTTVFLSADEKFITAVPGYMDAKTFLLILEYIKDEQYQNVSWKDFVKSREP